jgi:chromosomal replication initiation ATPase DnaA
MELLKIYTTVVCDFYSIPYEFAFLETRRKELVQIRQMVCSIAREIDHTYFRELGVFFGKDHSNVISGLKKVNNYLLTDKVYKAEYKELLEKCRKAKSMNYFYNIENDFCDISHETL